MVIAMRSGYDDNDDDDGGGGDDDAAAGFRWGDPFGDVGFGTRLPDASTDVLRIACNPKRCTAAWYSRAAVSSSL